MDVGQKNDEYGQSAISEFSLEHGYKLGDTPAFHRGDQWCVARWSASNW